MDPVRLNTQPVCLVGALVANQAGPLPRQESPVGGNVLAGYQSPMTLSEAVHSVRSGVISSETLTRAALDHARAVQARVNCFISIDEERALEDARRADQAAQRGESLGPLHGVPLAHKDMFSRAGEKSTAGSFIFDSVRAATTSTVVQRLSDAGAVWLGGLNMSEFAANPLGTNETFGRCLNAWQADRISAGSSSGSAVAVATGACFAALGSDTGGSIRLPAAANGVVGLKPTYGRVSRHGAFPRAWSMDTIGPIARTARDCAIVLRVIAGHDPMDITTPTVNVLGDEGYLDGDVAGVRIGLVRGYFCDGVSSEAEKAMLDCLSLLQSLGASVSETDVPEPGSLYTLGNRIMQVEAAAIHRQWLQEFPHAYTQAFRDRTLPGMRVTGVDYLEALAQRCEILERWMTEVFSRLDVLMTPVLGHCAPIFCVQPAVAPTTQQTLATLARTTLPISTLGLPALSLPVGFAGEGLPLAVQLIAKPFAEPLLLKVADTYQRSTTWHRRLPDWAKR